MATIRTVTVKPSGGDYTSLAAAEAGEQGDLVSLDRQLNIECYSMEDTTSVFIDGSTTDATRYISIYTPATERHDGKWNNNKYRLVADDILIGVRDRWCRIDGIQLSRSFSSGLYPMVSANTGSSGPNLTVSNCIFRDSVTYDDYDTTMIQWEYVTTAAGNEYVFNNIFYHPGAGTRNTAINNVDYAGNHYYYNNTFVDLAKGIVIAGDNINCTAKNNIAFNCTDGYSANIDTADCNAYSEGSDPGTNGVDISAYSGSDIFVDYANKDFHLKSTSPVRGLGASLTGIFTTDIDGQTRSGSWDIGADQYVAAGGGPAVLQGSVSCSSTVAAALTAGILLLGALAGQASASGTLTGVRAALQGSISASASDTGSLTTAIRAAGAVSGAASVTGAMTTQIRLAGSTSGSATGTGALTTQIRLAGTASGSATDTGALTTQIRLSGAVSGSATVTGAFAGTAAALQASVAGSSSVSGSLTTQIRLAGSTSGSATGTGALAGTAAVLQSSVAGSSSVSGALTSNIPLQASTLGSASVSGTLTTSSGGFSGAVSGSSATTAQLSTAIRLAGQVFGAGTVSGNIYSVYASKAILATITMRQPDALFTLKQPDVRFTLKQPDCTFTLIGGNS
jgi:hypothetical protein